ncbi:MAG TPA: oligosaccharide flippase family protein [Povalibacter sp.]
MLPFLISHLGMHSYGLWVAIGTLTANYYLLDVGLASAVTRNVAGALATNDSQRANHVINTALWIYLAIAAVVAVCAVGMAFAAQLFIERAGDIAPVRQAVLITGLTLALHFPFNALSGIIQARARYDLLAIAQVLTLAFQTGATVVLIRGGYGIVALAWIGAASAVLSNYLHLRIARSLFADLTFNRSFVNRQTARSLFGYSTWSFVAQLADQARSGIDPLVVGHVRGAEQITRYSVGSRLVDYTLQLLYRATNTVTPVLTRMLTQGRAQDTHAAVSILLRINVVLVVFAAGALITFVHNFLTRWMGPGYDTSATVAIILIAAKSFEFSVAPLDSLLYAAAKHKYLSIILMIEGAINVGLSLILGQTYGLIGVALGTAIPLIIFRVLVFVPMTARITGIPLSKIVMAFARPAAIGVLIMTVLAAAYHSSEQPISYLAFAIEGLTASAVYFPLMFLCAFSKEEKRRILSAIMASLGMQPRQSS